MLLTLKENAQDLFLQLMWQQQSQYNLDKAIFANIIVDIFSAPGLLLVTPDVENTLINLW